MSFHHYLVPPPLALAVHPAPVAVSRSTKDKKDSAADRAKGKNGKGDPAGADAAVNKPPVDAGANAAKPTGDAAPDGAAEPDADARKQHPPDSPQSNVPEPPTPAPGALPRSPAGDARDRVRADMARRAAEREEGGEGAGEGKADQGDEADEGDKNDKDDKEDKVDKDDKGDKGHKGDDKPSDTNNSTDKSDQPPAETPAPPPEPLRLLAPAPPKYVRTRLDLHPSKPYPPVYADPRGAYHSYAKWVQTGGPFIDLTKDGWLVEQWRERGEREALARLRGDADRQRQREEDAERKRKLVRKVPDSAEQIVLELYNDLVEAPHNELNVDLFWARYDWSDPAAAVHLLDIRRAIEEKDRREGDRHRYRQLVGTEADGKAKAGGSDEAAHKAGGKGDAVNTAEGAKVSADETKAGGDQVDDKAKAANDQAKAADDKVRTADDKPKPVEGKPAEGEPAQADKAVEADEDVEYPAEAYPDVEWTKGGLEETLATVGIVCSYNIKVPARELPNAEPLASLLVLSHSHFLLRPDDYFSWRPEASAGQFEMLVASGHDRVFGEMVRAQQAEERKRKEAAYKKRKDEQRRKDEEERRARRERGEPEPEGKGEEGKDGKGDKDKVPDDKEKKDDDGKNAAGKDGKQADAAVAGAVVHVPAEKPEADGSNVKVKDGEQVAQLAGEGQVIVVPAQGKDGAPKELDAKHEQEAVIAELKVVTGDAVGEAAKRGGGEGKAGAGQDGKAADGHDKDAKAKDDARRRDAAAAAAARKRDPLAEAEMMARLMGLDADGPLNMDDVKLAMRALELQASRAPAPAHGRARGPLIWAWQERCERWRWANYAAGVHDVRPGGWEERDWREYADGRGFKDFEADMAAIEVCEIDVHDWSC
ncbi:hypothetical protein Q5752_006235 [Cryptotrichosporon argae]